MTIEGDRCRSATRSWKGIGFHKGALAQTFVCILSFLIAKQLPFYWQAMDRITRNELRQVVESQHACKAGLVRTVFVTTTIDGEGVWEGEVYVFDLAGHPKANQAYAWLNPRESSRRPKVVSMLRHQDIATPSEAVQATLTVKTKLDFGQF
jgi:hypothetical protein